MDLFNPYESTLKGFRSRAESLRREYHALLSIEPQDSAEAEKVLSRLVTSELPEYIEDTRESFKEINSIRDSLSFGRDSNSSSASRTPGGKLNRRLSTARPKEELNKSD